MSNAFLSPEEEAAIRDAIADALSRSAPGFAPRLDQDAGEFLRLVAIAASAVQASNTMLDQAVTGARRAGLSWEAIGSVLGVTRQAVQKRFGSPGEAPPEERPERRVLKGVHAFNEQAVLEAQGRQGYHLVEFGPLYMVFERTVHPWQHRRLTLATGSTRARLQSEGWQEVGSWFPFTYLKRPQP